MFPNYDRASLDKFLRANKDTINQTIDYIFGMDNGPKSKSRDEASQIKLKGIDKASNSIGY